MDDVVEDRILIIEADHRMREARMSPEFTHGYRDSGRTPHPIRLSGSSPSLPASISISMGICEEHPILIFEVRILTDQVPVPFVNGSPRDAP
jgi:hypothetical protein